MEPQVEARSGCDALIGGETAVCAVLLVGALLLLRTFVNLVNVPTGFDAEGVVTARWPSRDRSMTRSIG